MHDAPDSTSNIAPPMSPLRVGSKPPEKRDGGKKHPGKSLRKKRVTETRGIQIGVKRLMCGYNVNLSTCCRWEGDYKLEPELFGGVR